MVKEVRPCRDNLLQRAVLMAEVGNQDLDGGRGRRHADTFDASDKLMGAAVRQVVAIDRSDNDVLQAELIDGIG